MLQFYDIDDFSAVLASLRLCRDTVQYSRMGWTKRSRSAHFRNKDWKRSIERPDETRARMTKVTT
jgi:hypothetical protein